MGNIINGHLVVGQNELLDILVRLCGAQKKFTFTFDGGKNIGSCRVLAMRAAMNEIEMFAFWI